MGQDIAVWGKWDKAKASLTGMKILAQVSDELQPVYHVAQGISQVNLVKAIKTAIDQGYLHLLEENLPSVLRERYRLMNRREAVFAMHFPTNLEEYRQALRRIKFEELFYFQLQLQMLKANNRDISNGLKIAYDADRLAMQIRQLRLS